MSQDIKSTFFFLSFHCVSAAGYQCFLTLPKQHPGTDGSSVKRRACLVPTMGALSPFLMPCTEAQHQTDLHFSRNFAVVPQLLYFSLRTSHRGWMAAFHSACPPLKKVVVWVLTTSGFLVCAFGLSNCLNLNFKADTLPDPFLLTSVLFMASSLLTFCFN